MKKITIISLLIFLTVLSARDYKGGELRTITPYIYGRFEVRMQSALGSGMLSSFFTYNAGGGGWNEIDIEILGLYTNQVQFNTITPGEVSHVYNHYTGFNPHENFHIYAFEWTPDYVAWFVDGIEIFRDERSHIDQLTLSQKIMMNMWIPNYPNWVGEWDDDILPVYAFYDWIKYYSYTPGSGNYGSDLGFSLQWIDDFEFWDQGRWQKATHTWWGNNCDFTPSNVVFQDGYMILCLTDNYDLGFSGEIPDDDHTYLRTEGPEILDHEGNPILLKGLGLGGWLVPEGYMLHIPGYGSPTSIREMISELLGESITESFYEQYEQNYITAADITQISDWGFNSVRLPIHYNKLSPEPDVYLEEGFAQIDSLLSWCEQNELFLILDMHCAPGGQNSDNISDSDGQAWLWYLTEHQEHTVQIWQTIAERYSNEEWIGGYDLLNEPVLPNGFSNISLRNLYTDIRNAIRSVDNNHILFIEGNWYATNFMNLTPPFDGNMVYAFHKYWSETGVETIQDYMSIREAYNIPIWLGESGENSNQWFAEVISMIETNNIGWNWWPHKKLDTITSPISANIPDQFQIILDYWDGDGNAPSFTTAIAGLMQMAENLAIENCVVHPDVLKAILEPSTMEVNSPFKDHSIPGSIDAVDYDMGYQFVSYSDDTSNNGYVYRNDGVDIEHSSGNCPTDFNVGWIEDNEWLEYTVSVQESGLYQVEAVLASLTSGIFQLKLEDEILTAPIYVAATGGWQNWSTQMVDTVFLQAGEHIIQVYVIQGGFNISQMNFDIVSMLGDLNMDTTLNVQDIVALIDLILFTEPDIFQLISGDLDENGDLDIMDVVILVDIILYQ